jgi:sarcosine oxidase subunit alpha
VKTMTQPAPTLARTPLHQWHTARGARFFECRGWQLPRNFADEPQEVAAARSGLALADLSAFAKISLFGHGVDEVAQSLGIESADQPRTVARLTGLTTRFAVLACRLTVEHLLVLGATPAKNFAELVATWVRKTSVIQTDVTCAYAGFCLVGPRTEEVLRRLTGLDVSPAAFPAGSCAETSVAGVASLLVRSAEAGVPNTRVYVSWDVGEYVWEELMAAGRPFGVMPVGLQALVTLGLIDL